MGFCRFVSGFRGLCFAGAFFLLTACVADKDWYRFQGVNVTECGPAVAAAGASFTGRDKSVAEARSFDESRTFWRLRDIYEYLLSVGVSVTWQRTSGIDWAELSGDRLGVFYTGSHFVIYQDGRSYDPLFGISAADGVDWSGDWFLEIRR